LANGEPFTLIKSTSNEPAKFVTVWW
jgi:hypothetical protein